MIKLSTNCHYIGQACYDTFFNFLSGSIYLGIIFTGLGLFELIQFLISRSDIYSLVIGAIVFMAGISNIREHFVGGYVCPKCNKRTMIPLDTPKAQALLKEHNLTIPEEASQQSTNPKTSQ